MSTTANVKTTGNEIENNFAGIDVAKDELVLHLLPSEKKLTVPNSIQGFKQLHNLFKDQPPQQIVCEATGGLERLGDGFSHFGLVNLIGVFSIECLMRACIISATIALFAITKTIFFDILTPAKRTLQRNFYHETKQKKE